MTKINLLRRKANLSRSKTAEICGVTERTVRNWEKGKTKTPDSAIKLIGLFCGRLDFLGESWKGFYFQNEAIVSSNGHHLFAFEVNAISWLYSAAKIDRFKLCKNIKKVKVIYHECDVNDFENKGLLDKLLICKGKL